MARLQSQIAEYNVYKWLADIFTFLVNIREEQDGVAIAALEAPATNTPALYGV
jgi:hypothetical protein